MYRYVNLSKTLVQRVAMRARFFSVDSDVAIVIGSSFTHHDRKIQEERIATLRKQIEFVKMELSKEERLYKEHYCKDQDDDEIKYYTRYCVESERHK